MIVEVLKPVGDVISFSNASVPYKRFLMVLVRRRFNVSLPVEIDFSFGMRRYKVIVTSERSTFPKFRRELGRYVLPSLMEEGDVELGSTSQLKVGPTPAAPAHSFSHEVAREEKGKDLAGDQQPKGSSKQQLEATSVRITSSRMAGCGHDGCALVPEARCAGSPVKCDEAVERSSRRVMDQKASEIDAMVEHGSQRSFGAPPVVVEHRSHAGGRLETHTLVRMERTIGRSLNRGRTEGYNDASVSRAKGHGHRAVRQWLARSSLVQSVLPRGEQGWASEKEYEVARRFKGHGVQVSVQARENSEAFVDSLVMDDGPGAVGPLHGKDVSSVDPLLLCEVGHEVGQTLGSLASRPGPGCMVDQIASQSIIGIDVGQPNLKDEERVGLGCEVNCDGTKINLGQVLGQTVESLEGLGAKTVSDLEKRNNLMSSSGGPIMEVAPVLKTGDLVPMPDMTPPVGFS